MDCYAYVDTPAACNGIVDSARREPGGSHTVGRVCRWFILHSSGPVILICVVHIYVCMLEDLERLRIHHVAKSI